MARGSSARIRRSRSTAGRGCAASSGRARRWVVRSCGTYPAAANPSDIPFMSGGSGSGSRNGGTPSLPSPSDSRSGRTAPPAPTRHEGARGHSTPSTTSASRITPSAQSPDPGGDVASATSGGHTRTSRRATCALKRSSVSAWSAQPRGSYSPPPAANVASSRTLAHQAPASAVSPSGAAREDGSWPSASGSGIGSSSFHPYVRHARSSRNPWRAPRRCEPSFRSPVK